MRLIVHLGQHKTGSKALQSFLTHNQAALRADGIIYPTWAGAGADHGIRAYAISQFPLFALLRHEALGECQGAEAAAAYWNGFGRFCAPFASSRAFLEHLDAEARRAGAREAIVSAEDLFDMHTAHELAFNPALIDAAARRLADLAIAFGHDVRLVVYLRRQDHLLGAHYVQFIKGGAGPDLDFPAFARAFAPRLDTRSILSRWAAVFGPGRINVRIYETSSLPGGIVADVFAHVLGRPAPPGCTAPLADAESVNRTLDRDFVEFLRVLNRRGTSGQSVFAREAILDAALNAPPGPSGIAAWLSPAARRDLLDEHHDGNAAIARAILGRDDGRLFTTDPPRTPDAWTAYPGFSAERATAIALTVHETILARTAPESVPVPPAAPRRRTIARRLGAIPGGLLGAIVLIAVVEWILGLTISRPKSFGVAEYQFAADALPGASRYPVVCLGDSMVKDGLLPGLIAAGTGRPTFNFAISGGRPPVTYLMLKRLLRAGARPSAIVLDVAPAVAAADFRDNLPGLAEIASLADAFDLAWTARDPRVLVSLTLGRVVTLMRERLDRHAPGDRDRLAPLLRNLAENAGALVLPESHDAEAPRAFWNERANLRTPWACDPLNAAYLGRTLALADRHAIAVFWIITPMHPRVQAGRERAGLDAAYTRFVRAVQARHPGVRVIDARRAGIAPARFVDAAHLDRRGAQGLSVALAALLADHFRGSEIGRWQDLPGYRERPIDRSIEDLDQSRLAVKGSTEKRHQSADDAEVHR